MAENKIASNKMPQRVLKPGFASMGFSLVSYYFYFYAQDGLYWHNFVSFTLFFILFLVSIFFNLLFSVKFIRVIFLEVQENPVLIPILRQFAIAILFVWIFFPFLWVVLSMMVYP